MKRSSVSGVQNVRYCSVLVGAGIGALIFVIKNTITDYSPLFAFQELEAQRCMPPIECTQ